MGNTHREQVYEAVRRSVVDLSKYKIRRHEHHFYSLELTLENRSMPGMLFIVPMGTTHNFGVNHEDLNRFMADQRFSGNGGFCVFSRILNRYTEESTIRIFGALPHKVVHENLAWKCEDHRNDHRERCFRLLPESKLVSLMKTHPPTQRMQELVRSVNSPLV